MSDRPKFTARQMYMFLITILKTIKLPNRFDLPTPDELIEFCEKGIEELDKGNKKRTDFAKKKTKERLLNEDELTFKIIEILKQYDIPINIEEIMCELDDKTLQENTVRSRLTCLRRYGLVRKGTYHGAMSYKLLAEGEQLEE